ncbi:Protein T20D3.6 [Aphelenchoides avenae]|nr:Protein T20D3.6 [Aphelenchus avenae]
MRARWSDLWSSHAPAGASDSPSDGVQRYLTWQKIDEPTTIKKTQRAIPNASSRSVVPPLPMDMLRAGSEKTPVENTIFRKAGMNPLVPIGMAATVACLIGICKTTLNGDRLKAQYYMRGRCAMQFFTVVALVGGVYITGNFDPSLFSSGYDARRSDPITQALLPMPNTAEN